MQGKPLKYTRICSKLQLRITRWFRGNRTWSISASCGRRPIRPKREYRSMRWDKPGRVRGTSLHVLFNVALTVVQKILDYL